MFRKCDLFADATKLKMRSHGVTVHRTDVHRRGGKSGCGGADTQKAEAAGDSCEARDAQSCQPTASRREAWSRSSLRAFQKNTNLANNFIFDFWLPEL